MFETSLTADVGDQVGGNINRPSLAFDNRVSPQIVAVRALAAFVYVRVDDEPSPANAVVARDRLDATIVDVWRERYVVRQVDVAPLVVRRLVRERHLHSLSFEYGFFVHSTCWFDRRTSARS